uniref:Uncharacterized protein n=1 Tax=Panagrolaimus davidi TaxID=227884 RepID=A0A914Q5H5_9BILA
MADTERKSLYISVPVVIKWKISKNTLLAEMQPHHPNWNIIGAMMDIPEMSGLEYRLSIGRNLQLPDDIVFVWLNVLYNQEIHLGFQGQLSVGRSNYEFNECFDEKAAAGKQICTKAELFDPERNFMVNDELIITFEGTAHSINPKVNIGDASEFQESMGERLMKRVDKDFTICASDGEEFKVGFI